jgi:transposase
VRPALAGILAVIERLTEEIRAFDRQLEKMVRERFPIAKQLQEITGVGVLTSLSFVLIIEDPRRFKRSRQVGKYLGLTPRKHESGESNPELGITKAGDELLRRLLVNAAHFVLGQFGTDSDLRRFGLRVAAGGGKGAKKRAVVAVARKLAVVMHRLWVGGEAYDPLYNANRQKAA